MSAQKEHEPVKQHEARQSLSDEVFNRMLVSISEGEWKPGHKIPSESQLCRLYAVSRVSVRSAIQRLKGQGLIETAQGVGSFVSEREGELPPGAPSDLSSKTFWEFLAFRLAIELKAIDLFVVRAGKEDIRHLEELVAKMHACDGVKAFTGLDYAFHSAILTGSRNPFLIGALRPYTAQYYHYMEEILRHAHKPLATIAHEHDMLFQALKDKRPDAAKTYLSVDLAFYQANHQIEA